MTKAKEFSLYCKKNQYLPENELKTIEYFYLKRTLAIENLNNALKDPKHSDIIVNHFIKEINDCNKNISRLKKEKTI